MRELFHHDYQRFAPFAGAEIVLPTHLVFVCPRRVENELPHPSRTKILVRERLFTLSRATGEGRCKAAG